MGQVFENIAKTVLIVEDEPLIRLMAIAVAEDEGFTVFEAQDADEAIAILEAHPEIRIVFTDINMAGSMDGLELAAYAYDRWPPLRFLIVSGEQRPKIEDMPAGACFFPKPYDTRAIGRALHTLL